MNIQLKQSLLKNIIVLIIVVIAIWCGAKITAVKAFDLLPSCTSNHYMCFSATCNYVVNTSNSGANRVVSVDRDWRANGCSCTNPYTCGTGSSTGRIIFYDYSTGTQRDVSGLTHTLEPGDRLEFQNFTETWPCQGTGPSYASFTNRCNTLNQIVNGPAAPVVSGTLNATASCSNTTTAKVDLSWNITGATTCYLFRDGNSSSLTSGNCSSGSFTNSGLSLNNPYTFYITTTNSSSATRVASRSVTTPTAAICNPPPVPTQASCGQANGHNFAASDTGYTSTYDQCDTGSPNTTAFPVPGGSQSWTCSGGGYTTSPTCTATRSSTPVPPSGTLTSDIKVNSRDSFFYVPPNSILTITWNCGGTNLWNYRAGSIPWPPITGWNGYLPTAVGSTQVTIGSEEKVFSLRCTNYSGVYADDSVNVKIAAVAVNGACGSTNNSCTSGTLSDIADSATNYLWNCIGQNGGTNASCSLTKPVAGTCGSANGRVYLYAASSWSPYVQCSTGTSNNTAMPVQSTVRTSSSWTCLGVSGGGNSPQCIAYRNARPRITVASASCGRITGTAIDPDGPNPINVNIYLGSVSAGNLMGTTTTNASGAFEFNFIPTVAMSGANKTIIPVAVDNLGDTATVSGDTVFACPVCGPAAKTYNIGETFPSGNLCNGGTADPANPGALTAGTTLNWECKE